MKQSEMDTESTERPIECAVRKKLQSHLEPVHLDILNESYMHNVPRGSETHFKVVIISDKFDNVPLIKVIIREKPGKVNNLKGG